MKNKYFIYVLSNKSRSTLYIGVTNNILRRIEEHKLNENGFTFKYKCFELIYIEEFDNPKEAIEREKELKKWREEVKKLELIKEQNPFLKNIILQLN